MTVRIVTDSACDLDQAVIDQYGIEVVPLTIRFGDDEFVDREELTVEDFYDRMAAADDLPETAAPSPGAFEAAFRRLADDGADAVVCINLSAALSATMQSAQNAAQAVGDDIDVRVKDSRSVTAGLSMVVEDAAKAAAAGASADEIEALVDDLSDRTFVFGALDTLDNLQKGGRIGRAQALAGSVLSIKPVIDLSTGEVHEAAKPRTRKKALAWLRDKVAEHDDIERLTVMHGMADDADTLMSMLADTYDDDIQFGLIGPVVGTHGGPRVIGVCFRLRA